MQPALAHHAQFNVADALQQLAASGGERFIKLFEHGSLLVEFYVPRGPQGELLDPQTPHTRDELYVIARGAGHFFNGTNCHPVQAGDLLFVAAGVEHRFENFTEDFATWVMFYGPLGGEARG